VATALNPGIFASKAYLALCLLSWKRAQAVKTAYHMAVRYARRNPQDIRSPHDFAELMGEGIYYLESIQPKELSSFRRDVAREHYLSSKFNDSARKIVSARELDKHVERLVKNDLSLAANVVFRLQKSHAFFKGQPLSPEMLARNLGPLDVLKKINADQTTGIWQNNGETYMSFPTYNHARSLDKDKFLPKKKMQDIYKTAFSMCRDYQTSFK
jgi:hypothetical protein